MNTDATANIGAKIAPGEGERRAQRGYVPQYDLAARVIYEALAAGRLQWIGLADRGAGAFDDVVLGLYDRIAAYQVKTSRDPEPFSISTVLLGAKNLLGRMIESRRKLGGGQSGTAIETIYACDDYPRTDDNVSGSGRSGSSAAFIRTHETYRLSWSLADWMASPFASFVAQVQTEAGLDDASFEVAWRNMRFLVGGQGGTLGLGPYSAADRRGLHDLAALLPRLVADRADRDRWTVSELLEQLGWRDPFGLRHGHAFPIDALYQSNEGTREALQRVLVEVLSGYISLIGPPGAGKSTLLSAGLLPTPRAIIIRYLAFVPHEGHGLGRAEAFDFLHDIIKQLKQQQLGAQIMPGTELTELREQFEILLAEASQRFQTEQIKTLIVVDGLDHVPREEKTDHSFLRELPLPHAVPKGVIFILGTQRLDLDGVPPAVRDEAGRDDRRIQVSPLSREAVRHLADTAGVPDDVDRADLYDRTQGHPLSTRYIIEGLRGAPTPEGRQKWLRDGPAYGGNVDVFYQRAWHDLERNTEARRALAYVALAEGPIRPVSLDKLVGSGATDAAWDVAGHLMVRNQQKAWSIFHNSFRLFLCDRTALRHGVSDDNSVRQRYCELANMARTADSTDPQRWMELRYCARASEHSAVVDLSRPERFRAQFIEGRNPGDIRNDIEFGFKASAALRRMDVVVSLILSQHEINIRASALGDEIFDTLVKLGEFDAARGLLEAEGVSLTTGKGYALVDALLKNGCATEARELFDRIEPINKLLGSEALKHSIRQDVVIDWAERALAFREPKRILAAFDRLQVPDIPVSSAFDMDSFRAHLKLVAARGQLNRHPDLAPSALMDILDIAAEHEALLLCFAANAAFRADDNVLAIKWLEAALPLANGLGSTFRRNAAALAARLNRLDLAAGFLEGVAIPSLAEQNFSYDGEDFRRASKQIVVHATLRARLGEPFLAAPRPASTLLATYQSRLETLGRLLGEARAGERPSVEPLREFRATLDFLEYAEGAINFDVERALLDKVMDDIVAIMVKVTAALGPEIFAGFITDMDDRLDSRPVRLSRFSVRQAYAMATFRYDHNVDRAVFRLASDDQGMETTSCERIAVAARTAAAFAMLGLNEKARALLIEMHTEGLGYDRPARKDPQYIFWRDLLKRACEEGSAGRPERLRFFGRLLAGMSKTEGNNAGCRLVGEFLDQASQAGPAWALAAADRVEEIGLATWPDLVSGLLTGIVRHRPDLAEAVGTTFGCIALPSTSEHDDSIYPQLIGAAPANQVESIVRHAVVCLETDGHPDRRVSLLQEVVTAAAERGANHGADALVRWRTELLPAHRSDYGGRRLYRHPSTFPVIRTNCYCLAHYRRGWSRRQTVGGERQPQDQSFG